MAIEQVNGATGIEQTAAVPKEPQQTATPPAENTEDTNLSATDVVTISPEAQDINARTTDNPNPAPAENTTESARERNVEQRVQENQDNAAQSTNEQPQRANNVDEVV